MCNTLQYPRLPGLQPSNFFKRISIRYWSTKSWILFGGFSELLFWRLAFQEFHDVLKQFYSPGIFYHSPNLLVQNPGFNPNVRSPFRQFWLDYHNGNDLISPWHIEKSPCTTYIYFKKKRKLGDVWLFTQHVFFSVQGSKSASLQKLNKASQIERICQMLKGRTTVSQTNMATKNTPPEV